MEYPARPFFRKSFFILLLKNWRKTRALFPMKITFPDRWKKALPKILPRPPVAFRGSPPSRGRLDLSKQETSLTGATFLAPQIHG